VVAVKTLTKGQLILYDLNLFLIKYIDYTINKFKHIILSLEAKSQLFETLVIVRVYVGNYSIIIQVFIIILSVCIIIIYFEFNIRRRRISIM